MGNMKRKISVIILCIILFSCTGDEKKEIKEFKEIVKVQAKSLLKINDSSENQFFYPKLIYDGSKIFFTTKEYNGIWYYDFETQLIINVSQINGVGKEFKFSKDSEKIYYVLPSVTVRSNEKNYALVEYDLASKSRKIIYNNLEGISNITLLEGNVISFWVNDNILFYDFTNKSMIPNYDYGKSLINNKDDKLLIYNNSGVNEKEGYNNQSIKSIQTIINKNEFYLTTDADDVIKFDITNSGFEFIGKFKNFGTSPNSNLLFYSSNSQLFIKSSLQPTFAGLEVKGANSIFTPSISSTNDSFVFNNKDGEIYYLELVIEEKLSD